MVMPEEIGYGGEHREADSVRMVGALVSDLQAKHDELDTQRASIQRGVVMLQDYLLSCKQGPDHRLYFRVKLPPDEPHYIVHVDVLAGDISYKVLSDTFVADWVRYDEEQGIQFVNLGDGLHESYVVVDGSDFAIEPLSD